MSLSVYMKQLFPRHNSSVLLRSGVGIQSKCTPLWNQIFVVDPQITPPTTATVDEFTRIPQANARGNPRPTEQVVGFLNNPKRSQKFQQSLNNMTLQRFFVDLVTGDPKAKLYAASRFEEMTQNDVFVEQGERHAIVMPRKYRKKRAWMELKNKWRNHEKVRGFFLEKVRGGYAVGVAGYVAFLPNSQMLRMNGAEDGFLIETMSNNKNFVVTRADGYQRVMRK